MFEARRALVTVVAGLAAVLAGPACAAPPAVTVSADLPLRFGALLVPASGTRIVTSRGQVIDTGLFAIGEDPVGPAQFTVTYDRGNESRRPIDVDVQVFLSGSGKVRIGAVEGELSQLESDIRSAGGGRDEPIVTLTLTDCRERRCSMTFRVGGRLDVLRTSGGAGLVIALGATASVLAVR